MSERNVSVECAECDEAFVLHGNPNGLTLFGTCPSCGAEADHMVVDFDEDEDDEDDEEEDDDYEDDDVSEEDFDEDE
jgi:hypothetical protein